MKLLTRARSFVVTASTFVLAGCTGISIAPSCPNELKVNESAPLLANEINPGAVAKYVWEVVPPQIGRVTDPTKPATTFVAISEGEAVIRLTASDGLYQVISQCRTRVEGIAAELPDDSGDDSGDETGDETVDDGKDETDGGGRPPRPGRRERDEPPGP